MKRYSPINSELCSMVERDDGKFVLYQDVKIMEDIKDCSDEIIKSLSESNNKLQHKAAIADKHLPKTADELPEDRKFVCECDGLYCPKCPYLVIESKESPGFFVCTKCGCGYLSNQCLATPRSGGAGKENV